MTGSRFFVTALFFFVSSQLEASSLAETEMENLSSKTKTGNFSTPGSYVRRGDLRMSQFLTQALFKGFALGLLILLVQAILTAPSLCNRCFGAG